MGDVVARSGETIFREGDPGGEAFVIQSGRVEIVKESSSGPIVLAHLEENEMFGEMSLIDEQPRSATARAIGDVVLKTIVLDEFVRKLDSEPEETFHYLRGLYQRIRIMNARLSEPSNGDSPRRPTDTAPSVLIVPTSPATLRSLPPEGASPRRYPVRVGRTPSSSDIDELDINDIRLVDTEPFNVSRDHFSIYVGTGGAYLKDRGSYLGTIVNGETVGGDRTVAEIELSAGENEVIVGGQHSPFRLAVIVERPVRGHA